ncbi:hypothetical protein NA57DRAFT_77745 [Rhizodiscina lignyota]|uniref:Stress response protein NST1 n=1 Tax=Rhizodiscina lignyota TaxID=1504668 RepID=A0A9P4ICI4_9PEZI|nr:hypothetical protein NA57DRAFT_77745 [Rhizodiscina lignyota]
MKQKNKRRQNAPAKPTGPTTTTTTPPKLPMHAQPESALALPETTSADQGYPEGEPYDPANGDDPDYSDDYGDQYHPDDANGVYSADHITANGSRKKSKKKRKNKGPGGEVPYDDLASSGYVPGHAHGGPPPPPPPPPSMARPVVKSRGEKDRIWNTSTQEERERIKEFWLSLGEEERKSLVKIEKEAVLRKMKEQQKHSCSCTVCGRKRTAIEEELEVLYDAYYEELEQRSNDITWRPGPLRFTSKESQQVNRIDPNRILPPASAGPRLRELADDEDPDLEDDELDEDEYSDDYADDDDYSEEDAYAPHPPGPAADLFNFGQHLTVKGKKAAEFLMSFRALVTSTGGILTVADDLLKNDGKKFIEMMEQLAERRMQREEEAQFAAAGMSHPHQDYGHNHGDPDDEYDDEDDYDSQDYDDEDEDEDDMDTMTEEQRMQEGRRMFQIFAARMFEQRVLQAYREKVARERQEKLLEELQEEDNSKLQKEAKKARDAQKKKDKKRAQQQAKAEEKARKDAEVAAEEAARKAEEEKKQDEQRRKKEEQRQKREAEKKAQEEERQKKEAERLRRQQQERERQQEAERKVREQKAAEKKAREEAKKKEREEREAREKEVREKKALEEKDRKEREAKEKEEHDARERARKEEEAARVPIQPPLMKRPSGPAAVPIPPGLHKQPSFSPQVAVATPAIPKAPTPNKPRQNSRQGSHGSSPKTPAVGPGKSTSPNHPAGPGGLKQPVQILTKPPTSQPQAQTQPQQSTSPIGQVMPPPGMPNAPFAQPPGFTNFPPQGQMMHNMAQRAPIGQNMPMFPHQTPQVPGQYRGFPPLNGVPPSMNGANMMPIGRGFSPEAPPGFQPQQPIGTPQAGNQLPPFSGASRESLPSHSRQQSGSDKPYEPPPIAPPISRPAPIQRPSSVKPHEIGEDNSSTNADVEDLTKHLGSKALLDDAEDEDIEPNSAETRRSSNQAPGLPRASTFASPFAPPSQLRADPFSSTWGTPGLGGFAPPGMPTANTWSTTSPHQGWAGSPFAGSVFGTPGVHAGPQNRRPQDVSLTRPQFVRKLVCAACRQLSGQHPTSDGWYELGIVGRQVDQLRPLSETPVPLPELLGILESNKPGTMFNGGGKIEVKHEAAGNRTMIKLEEAPGAIGTPGGHDALGGLGVSGMASPALNTALPFGGLGARNFLAGAGPGGF